MNSLKEEYYQYLIIEKNYSSNTIEAYQRDIDQFDYLIKKEYRDITFEDIKGYILFLRNNYSNNTMLRKNSAVKNYFKYLFIEKEIEKNYFDQIHLSKKIVKLPKYLTISEINLFLNSLELKNNLDYRNKAMFELIYATGLRISELINLELKNININENLIRVVGKGSVERIVPINDIAIKYLEVYIKNKRIELDNGQSKKLFLNKNGGPLTRQGFYKVLKTKASIVGIIDISPHKFRHSIATHMLNGGANLKVVQEMLGHKNISTTEIYTHVTSEKIVDEYNRYHIFGKDKNV